MTSHMNIDWEGTRYLNRREYDTEVRWSMQHNPDGHMNRNVYAKYAAKAKEEEAKAQHQRERAEAQRERDAAEVARLSIGGGGGNKKEGSSDAKASDDHALDHRRSTTTSTSTAAASTAADRQKLVAELEARRRKSLEDKSVPIRGHGGFGIGGKYESDPLVPIPQALRKDLRQRTVGVEANTRAKERAASAAASARGNNNTTNNGGSLPPHRRPASSLSAPFPTIGAKAKDGTNNNVSVAFDDDGAVAHSSVGDYDSSRRFHVHRKHKKNCPKHLHNEMRRRREAEALSAASADGRPIPYSEVLDGPDAVPCTVGMTRAQILAAESNVDKLIKNTPFLVGKSMAQVFTGSYDPSVNVRKHRMTHEHPDFAKENARRDRAAMRSFNAAVLREAREESKYGPHIADDDDADEGGTAGSKHNFMGTNAATIGRFTALRDSAPEGSMLKTCGAPSFSATQTFNATKGAGTKNAATLAGSLINSKKANATSTRSGKGATANGLNSTAFGGSNMHVRHGTTAEEGEERAWASQRPTAQQHALAAASGSASIVMRYDTDADGRTADELLAEVRALELQKAALEGPAGRRATDGRHRHLTHTAVAEERLVSEPIAYDHFRRKYEMKTHMEKMRAMGTGLLRDFAAGKGFK